MVVRVPETTRETTYIERSTFVAQPEERHTDKLPVVTPKPVASPDTSVVVITQPERSANEPPVREQSTPNGNQGSTRPGRTDDRAAPVPVAPPSVEVPPSAPVDKAGSAAPRDAVEVKEPERKTLGPEQKPDRENVPSENKKRSENNPPNNSTTIPPRNDQELIAPNKPSPQADGEEFEKIGPGRQRRYDELGEKDVEPVRELVLFRNEFGRHWPGLSKDMEQYYEHYYFTRPNKRKDGKNYERHVKCWERRTKWLAATQPTPDSH